MKRNAETIRIKPLTAKAIQQFRCRLIEQELDRLGDAADMESIFTATVDTILFAALRVALAPAIPTNTSPPTTRIHHAAHNRAQTAIIEKFPAPVENDATNE